MLAHQGPDEQGARFAISIDVGGTFTDFVLFDLLSGHPVAFHKRLTDPRQPALPVLSGWRDVLDMASIPPEAIVHAVHSTTLITNAIVERSGATTALITTRGFRDVLDIGIEQMYDIYSLFAPYPQPLIPRQLRHEISERVASDGSIVEPLDDQEARVLIGQLSTAHVRSVAVSLLQSYTNPGHEQRLAEIVAEVDPKMTVSLSYRVAPVVGEYDRTSTVVADAYVKPILHTYVTELLAGLRALGYKYQLYMVLSSGGITTAETAMDFPIRLLESGPAAGAFAAGYYGQTAGHADVLSLDMGGTTAKACLIEGGVPEVAHMLEVDRIHRFQPGSGLPIMTPTVDLIEIGAGGGSIAYVNELGLVNVGPESAGADPGPACYGLGAERPTVTDANLLLGYLDPAYFLGGRMALDTASARNAVQAYIASPLGIPLLEAAWGVHAIVNENMAQAARTHIIERNRDPRDLALVAFGGAGPAHACAVARILGISLVIIPLGAGVASAIGALTAPIAMPFVRTYMTSLDRCDWHRVRSLYDEMRGEAVQALASVERDGSDVQISRAVDVRFAGQYHELRVDIAPDLQSDDLSRSIETSFHARYQDMYGRVPPGLGVEALNWHLVGELPRRRFVLATEAEQHADHEAACKGERVASFGRAEPGTTLCAVYDRLRLRPGMAFEGPCIIEEPEATIVVPPGNGVRIDTHRNVVIHLGETAVSDDIE